MSYCPCSSAEDQAGSLENLVKRIIKKLKSNEHLGEEEIAGAWKSAVGEKAAAHTRPVSFRRATLIVNVDGSSWLYELTLKKRDILKELEGRLRGKKLKSIRFRIGEIRK